MRARLLGAAVCLLTFPSFAASADANGAPAPPDPVSALDAARAAAALEQWDAARAALGNISAGLLARPAPADPPGRDLGAHLDALADAAAREDAAAFAVEAALVRAGAVHASLAVARDALARGAVDLWLLPRLLDLDRAGPEFAALWDRVPLEPDNATLQDRALQRLLDRVSEAARVEVALAGSAVDAGLPDDAAEHAGAADALARALAPEAAQLPEPLRAGWEQALADWPEVVASMDAEGTRNASEALRTVLLGLGLGRTLVLLDSHADAVLVVALAAEQSVRLARSAPTVNASLLNDATALSLTSTHQAHRGAIFDAGEGDIGPLDTNVTSLGNHLAEGSSLVAIHANVEYIRGDLRRIAHLTFGSFAKIEFVNIPQNYTRNFTLFAGRFPFAGVASWEAALRWDPGIAQAVQVSSGLFELDVVSDNANGTLRLRGARTSAQPRDAILANFVFQGLGPQGSSTNVTFDSFGMVAGDGREVEVFLLRPGNVFIALFDPGAVANATGDDDENTPTNPALRERTPGPEGLAVVALALPALVRRRRIGP